MRILNRPMFRYGGPIKEGIMHGVRSNYAGGQRVMPSSDGSRPGYGGPAIPIGMAVWPHIARLFGSQAIKKVGQNVVSNKATHEALKKAMQSGTTQKMVGDVAKKTAGAPGWKNLFKNYWSGDPTVKGAQWAGKTLTSPGANTLAQKTVRGLLSPTSLALSGGATWMFWPDGTPKTKEEIAATGGKPGEKWSPGVGGEQYDPSTSPSALAAKAKADRKIRLDKYLDTMGYDKAKKTAMGDALIDASAIVQQGTEEGGSLKHADWGKMINKAIQSTSKRLDKPEQIREAVGLMMTKTDIEKEASAEEDALKKIGAKLNIKIAQKSLAGETLQESINAAYQKSGKFASGSDLAGLARTKGIEVTKVLPIKDIPDGISAIDYITTITENAKKGGKPYPEGHYVIKDRLVEIDVNGNIIKHVI
jgi:hypothetical protein